MKIEVKVAEERLTFSPTATVLEVVLTTHKACRAKGLPIPEYYYVYFADGYFGFIAFNQYQLASELKEFPLNKEITILTSCASKIFASEANLTANLSLRTLRQRMRKIISIMLAREMAAYYIDSKKSDTEITKFAEIAPKTLQMLTKLKEYNLEEKIADNQLISNREIAEIKQYIEKQRPTKLYIESPDRLYDRTLTGTGERYQLEEDIDLEFPLPVDSIYMLDEDDEQQYFTRVPKFVGDIKNIFIDIQTKKQIFKKDSTLKIFELFYKDIVNQFKENGRIDLDVINSLKNCLSELLWKDYQLLDYLINKNHEFIEYLKVEYHEYSNETLSSAVASNLVRNLKLLQKIGWKISGRHFYIAVNNHAVDSLFYLLQQYKLSSQIRLKLAKSARKSGNVAMINLLMPEEPMFYFSAVINEISKSAACILQEASIKLLCMQKNEIFLLVSKAYRYSCIESVQRLCADFIECLKNLFSSPKFNFIIDFIQKEINRAHEEFAKWGNQIAWYYTKNSADGLNKVYTLADMYDISKEIKFGLDNFALVETLCTRKFPKTIEIINDLKLPVCESPENFYSMSDLLKIMSDARSQQAKEREENNPASFARRRLLPCPGTKCTDRYGYMQSLIEIMATFNNDDSLDIHSEGYELQYKGEVISAVVINKYEKCWTWQHGLSTKEIIEKFWPDVENLHKKLFEMDLKQILENPQAFYTDVVEVLWLMGNLQVMQRGTGRYVEQWFAMVHRIHGLPVPKLKLGQLDCYNITFSLPVYKKIFLYFFDLKSLHPKVLAEMKKQYMEDPETRRLVKKFNLAVPADFIAAMYDDQSGAQELKDVQNNTQQQWQSVFQMLHVYSLDHTIKLIGSTTPVSKEIAALLAHYASRHTQQKMVTPWLKLTRLLYQQMSLLIATHTHDSLAMAVIIAQQISATLATEDYKTLKSNCANSENILYKTLNKNIFSCDPKFKKFITSSILFDVKKLITDIDEKAIKTSGEPSFMT